MATYKQRLFRVGRGMGFKASFQWGLGYAPVYVRLLISSTPDMLDIVWDTNSNQATINVSEQDVVINISSTSQGVNSGNPEYDTLTDEKYHYAIDFSQTSTSDIEFRLQGDWTIVSDVGNIPPGTPDIENLTFGTVDVALLLAGSISITTIGGGVAGPVSSVDENIALFDGVDGSKIKDAGTGLGGFVTNPMTSNLDLANNDIVNAGEVNGVTLETGGIGDTSLMNDGTYGKPSLRQITTQNLNTAVVGNIDIYYGDPINNIVNFNLPPATDEIDELFIFVNADSSPGVPGFYMTVTPDGSDTILGNTLAFIISHPNEYVHLTANTTTNWIGISQQTTDFAALALTSPTTQEITTTPQLLDTFDVVGTQANGRLLADVATSSIEVIQVIEPQDGYQINFAMSIEFDANNVEIFFTLRYNGVDTGSAGQVTARGNNNSVGVSFSAIVAAATPAKFEIFVSAGSAGTLEVFSCQWAMNRIGG